MNEESTGFIGQEISALKKDRIVSEKELESMKNNFADYIKANFNKEDILMNIEESGPIKDAEVTKKPSLLDRISKLFSK